MRREEPDMDVPWFECDNAGSKTLGQMIGVESDTEVSSVQESRRKSETAARTREVEEQNRGRSERDRERSDRDREQRERRSEGSRGESGRRNVHDNEEESGTRGRGRTPTPPYEGGETTPRNEWSEPERVTVHAEIHQPSASYPTAVSTSARRTPRRYLLGRQLE